MKWTLIILWFVFVFVMTWIPAYGQTTAAQSAEILRNLDSPVNATHRQYVSVTRLRPRPVVVPRTATPAASAPVVERRLDGTRKSNPPMVYGFTPHDWQWWYQQEIHREVRH